MSETIMALYIRALLSTGRVKHLSGALVPKTETPTKRQPPPALPGPSLSEIIIAQRRGEM